MGSVFLARDERLDRLVAIKVLHPEGVLSDEARSRFLREARAAASIRHPNIATIYEVGETAEHIPYFVMEFCEGETLAQRLRRKPVEAGEFLSVARQLAAGVAAAHEGGIVHRDLKSANVILEPTGQVKILDFGLARAVHQEMTVSPASSSGKLFGTLHYLSPEQAQGQPADERSDLFSLGIVFYQMATGQLPFNADVPLMVLEKIRSAEPEPFVARDSAFPPSAAKIIGKLLQKDPRQRYQTAQALLSDLQEIDTPTALLTVPGHSRSFIGRTRPSVHWGRMVLLTLAVIGGGAGLYLIGQRAQRASVETGPPPSLAPIRSLAVMPLDNISNSVKDDFLSVGLADALVNKLQQIPSLQVRPTSSILQFRNRRIDAKTASEELHVDSLLEGHFLAAGDLVRVNLQLTDGRTGYNVWADTVDGKRDNLLKLIDEVSSRTVIGLNQKLGVQKMIGASEARSSNPKAFEAYLKARAGGGSLVQAEYQNQVENLKRAVELDPNFAAAFADLAIAYSMGQARGLVNEPGAVAKSEWYARQAVRLDPNLAISHLALSRAFVRSPGRFRESVRENLAALRLNPSEPQSLNAMTTYFVSIGESQKAQCVGERMVRLDPDSNDAKTRGYWYVNSVDPEGALASAQYALASRDTALAGHDIRANAFLLTGNLAGARSEAQHVIRLSPDHYLSKSLNAMIAAASADSASCLKFLQSFEADANRNHWAAMRQALCYAKLGETDRAVQWVQKAAALGNHSWYAWVKHPWTQSLQPDPEFQKSLAQMKLDLDDVRDDMIGVYQLLCK